MASTRSRSPWSPRSFLSNAPPTDELDRRHRSGGDVLDGARQPELSKRRRLDSLDQLAELVDRDQQLFLRGLERSRGRLGRAARLLRGQPQASRWRDVADSVPDPRSESGTAYLRDRLETRQSARRLASELDPLAALARSIRRALSPRRDLPVLHAYLVDRGRVGEFVALVEQLRDCLDGVDLVCTGPCPPYSFADGGAQPGGAIRSTV